MSIRKDKTQLKAEKRQIIKNAKKAVSDAKRAAKREAKLAEKIYKEKIKEMRPYMRSLRNIDLRKHVSAAQKSYVTKAWDEYQELTARPYRVFKTPNKKHLKIAQAYSRHEEGKPKFDVAFIPTADPKAKLKFKDDRLIIKSKYVTETTLFFDLKKLATNPGDEIRRVMAKNPDAKQFIIMAGKYLYNGGLARSLVENEVTNLMARYSTGGEGLKKRGENSRWENWLFGLVAFQAHDQKSINEYRLAYRDARDKQLSKRKNMRRKRGQKFGEKF